MAKYSKKNCQDLLEKVGGGDNVVAVSHCLTRLRFVLKDENEADVEALENLSFVKGVFNNAGQFQVIIGTDVPEFFKLLNEVGDIQTQSKDELKKVARQNMSLLERTISHLAEIFVPLLPAIITGGLILGFRNIIGDIAMIDGKTLVQISPFWATVHSFLWLIGEAVFHFLPVGITWSVVRKMGGSPILGIVLGITLVSGQLMNAYNIGKMIPDAWDFGFFQIQKVGYQAQVIPSILAGMVLAYLETKLKKIIPSYLHLVIVPFVALLTSVFLAHALIGPVGRVIGDGVGFVAKLALTGPLAVVGSAVFGFLYSPLVITGVHHTTNAVDLQLVQELGGTMLWPLIALSNIAQGSAVVGVLIASKKVLDKELGVPAAISAYLGVTEPAMYGINLKYKFPMLCAMIGSALAATVAGMFGIMSNGIGVGGLPAILSIKPQYWTVYLLAMLISIVFPIVSTMIIYKRKFGQNAKQTQNVKA